MTECTISVYIGSKTTARERIEAIESLIDTMMLRMTEVGEGSAATVDEFSLDDGQMRVRTSYRSIADVEAGIKALLRLKSHYVNQYNGNITVLRDVRGLS